MNGLFKLRRTFSDTICAVRYTHTQVSPKERALRFVSAPIPVTSGANNSLMDKFERMAFNTQAYYELGSGLIRCASGTAPTAVLGFRPTPTVGDAAEFARLFFTVILGQPAESIINVHIHLANNDTEFFSQPLSRKNLTELARRENEYIKTLDFDENTKNFANFVAMLATYGYDSSFREFMAHTASDLFMGNTENIENMGNINIFNPQCNYDNFHYLRDLLLELLNKDPAFR